LGRVRRARIRVAFIALALCAFFPTVPLAWAHDSGVAAAKGNSSITFDCSGHAPDEKNPPHFASGAEVKFEVSATFGEGATVALVDPETSAIRQPLYDAETAVGHLKFSGGEETTIVWTRMSGSDGALMGGAILSDGDVLALTIERAAQGTPQRPLILFSAASASLVRGTCVAAAQP
jgi:hypothetical protein